MHICMYVGVVQPIYYYNNISVDIIFVLHFAMQLVILEVHERSQSPTGIA